MLPSTSWRFCSLICGAATVVSSFWAGNWSGAIVNVLIGVLYIVIGFAITEKPLGAAAMLTLFIAVLFTISGIFRTITALSIRYPQWGWGRFSTDCDESGA